MKAKLLIVSILIAVIIAACSPQTVVIVVTPTATATEVATITATSTRTSIPTATERPTVTPRPTSTRDVAAAAYRQRVASGIESYQTGLSSLGDLLGNFLDDNSLLFDPIWNKKVDMILEKLVRDALELSTLPDVPDRYQAIDQMFDELLLETIELQGNMSDGIKNINGDSISLANDNILNIHGYLDKTAMLTDGGG